MRKLSKAGFTLVECIIAMLIIAIITGSAIGIYEITTRTVNKQWENYQITQMADNILSCFEGSDDTGTFENHLSQLSSVGNTKIGTGTIKDDSSYLEYDTSDAEVPVGFKTIRAYETGKVEFYDKALDVNTDYTNPILSLDYDNSANYEYDVHGKATANSQSLDNLGIYSVQSKTVDAHFVSITATYTSSQNSNVKLVYTVTENTVTLESTDAGNNKVTKRYATTAIEKEYLANGWFIKIFDSYNSYSTKKLIRFEVYDCKTGQKAKDSNDRYMYVLLVGTINDAVWTDESSGFNVTELRVAHTTAETAPAAITSPLGLGIIKQVNSKDYSGSYDIGSGFTWKYLPAYVKNTNSDYHAYDLSTHSYYYAERGLVHTDYTMKDGHNSEIAYTIESNNYVKFYNGNEFIYRYTMENTGLSKLLSSLPLEYDSVRTYNNGTIAFYKGDACVYSYNFNSTVQYGSAISKTFAGNTVYKYSKTENAGKNIVRVSGGDYISDYTFMSRQMLGTCNYYVDTVEQKYILAVYEDTDGNTSRKKSKYQNANALELDLANKGLILYFDKYSLDKTNRTFYLHVIDAASGKLKTDALGRNMFIRIKYSADSSTADRWNTDKKYFILTDIDYTYSYATGAEGLRNDSSAVYNKYESVEPFKWTGAFLAYAFDVCDKAFQSAEGKISTNHVYKYKPINSYDYTSEYKEYTLKDSSMGRVVDYFESDKAGVLIGNDKTVLLSNPELAVTTRAAKMDITVAKLKSSLDFQKEKTDKVTGGTERYKALGAVKLPNVVFDDTNRIISFKSTAGDTILNFEYGSTTEGIKYYNLDKGEIIAEGGAFKQYYTGNKVKIDGYAVLRKGADSTGRAIYQVSLKSEADPDGTIIFISYAGKISAKSSDVTADSSFSEVKASVETPDTYEWITKYYSYSISYYSCIAKVTYSKYVGDISVEPSIKIWLVTTDELDEWKAANEGKEPTEPTEKVYIYYRKG